MSEPDVVALLDARPNCDHDKLVCPMALWSDSMTKRARDEIVALRTAYEAQTKRWNAAKARAEALEECIRVCPECADRIRALKDD